MYNRVPWFRFLKAVVLGSIIGFVIQISAAQQIEFEPATPPIANPADKRFVDVYEDLTTPSLSTSNLHPIPPVGFFSDNPGYTLELSQVQWRWGDPIDLYVLKPKGVNNPPVILYIYSYNYDTDVYKNEAWQRAVTKDGFAAVGFVTALTGHRYHDVPMRKWFVSELQTTLAASAHDVQMVLNHLATRHDLDMDRVGIFAEGSGASIAILASAVDPRIKVIDAVDPWGDWPTWMATSPFVPEDERPDYVKPEYLQKVAALEPVEWLPKIQAKKFRLQDAIFETTTPKASKEKLRAAAPPATTIVVYKDLQEYRAAINGNKQMDWMHRELRTLPDTAANATTAMQAKPKP